MVLGYSMNSILVQNGETSTVSFLFELHVLD